MARPTQKEKREQPGFDVTVESVIGRVTLGDGDTSPTVAAFTLIAEYFDNSYTGGTFTFVGPAEGERIRVTVEQEFPNND